MIQQPDPQRYREQAQAILANHGLPAIVAVTLTSEQILSAEVYGTRVQGTDNMATLDDFFHIGSCAKSMLASAAGKMVEAGKIAWQSALFDVVPDLEAKAHDAYAGITLSDLLLCRAGLPAFTSAQDQFPDLNPLLPDVRKEFARKLLARDPVAPRQADGSFPHVYSNASYTVAAVMLEAASAFDWETTILQTLVDGYGVDVRFGWPNIEEPEFQPWGHMPGPDGNLRFLTPGDPYGLSPLIAPAGDLSMRPLHYARYIQQHLRGLRGDNGWLGAATVRHIHRAQPGFSLGVGNGRYFGKEVSQVDGSAGTFYCHTIIVPGDDFAFVILTNAGGEQATAGVYALSAEIMKQRFPSRWWQFWG